MRIVIMQPMFLPWVGQFELLRLADAYVHFDDVQYCSRSLMNRVKIKGPAGPFWLTVPVRAASREAMDQVRLDNSQDWRRKHLRSLAHCYARAPHRDEMLDLVQDLYRQPIDQLVDLNRRSIEAIAAYFGLRTTYHSSRQIGGEGKATPRLLSLLARLGGTVYLTGHGAAQYLDHQLLERASVQIEYLDYQRRPYPQLHGSFDPHCSALDLIANCGPDGREVITSGVQNWREHLASLSN